MKTPREIYEELRAWYMKEYKGHFFDRYEGHHHHSRVATLYAMRNTLPSWKSQFDR